MRNELASITVLVVEDDQLLNITIRRLLDGEGLKSESYSTGAQALLREFPSTDTVLMLLDYSLPDMSARDLLNMLRAKSRNVPFIIITGHGDEQLAVEMMKLGAMDYIAKNMQFHDVLAEKVRRACKEIANKRLLTATENSLRESEQKYRTLVERANDGILIVQDGVVSFANARLAEIVAGSVERLEGARFADLFQPDEAARILEMHGKRMAGETVPAVTETVLRRRDSSTIRAEISSGIISYWGAPADLIMVRDITERIRAEEERKELEDRLRHSQKLEAVGQLASGVVHDFNNVLGGIMGNAELIHDRAGGDAELKKFADRILRSSAKAAELTKQLLAFARKGRVNFKQVDIHSSIGNVIELLGHTIDKRIEIATNFHATISKVTADSNQIENAFLNIALNARDAMPEGGRLTFATSNVELTKEIVPAVGEELAPGPYMRVSIEDTGIGIDQDTMGRIFEPFFTTKGPGRGTGLGLAVAYGCIRQHNGHIAVESEKGKGTSFILLLPASAIAAHEEPQPDAGPVRGCGSVMILDDEEVIAATTAELVTALGYKPVYFTECSKALTHYQKHHASIDAVVLDLVMPEKSGLDVFRSLKQTNKHVRVIVASGYSDANQEKQVFLEEPVEFIRKPYNIIGLSRALEKAVSNNKKS